MCGLCRNLYRTSYQSSNYGAYTKNVNQLRPVQINGVGY